MKEIQGSHRQGWVPCQILQSVDEPIPGTGIPGDAAFRRQWVYYRNKKHFLHMCFFRENTLIKLVFLY